MRLVLAAANPPAPSRRSPDWPGPTSGFTNFADAHGQHDTSVRPGTGTGAFCSFSRCLRPICTRRITGLAPLPALDRAGATDR